MVAYLSEGCRNCWGILWLRRHSQTDVSFTANNYTPRNPGEREKAQVYLNKIFTWRALSPAPSRFIWNETVCADSLIYHSTPQSGEQ